MLCALYISQKAHNRTYIYTYGPSCHYLVVCIVSAPWLERLQTCLSPYIVAAVSFISLYVSCTCTCIFMIVHCQADTPIYAHTHTFTPDSLTHPHMHTFTPDSLTHPHTHTFTPVSLTHPHTHTFTPDSLTHPHTHTFILAHSYDGKVKHYLIAMDFKNRKMTINGQRYFSNLPALVEVCATS